MAEYIEETGEISPDYGIHCDLQPLSERLQEIQYPISKANLLSRFGAEALPCSEGDRHTLKDLLEPLTKEQYNSFADIQDTLEHPVRLAHI